MDFGDGDAVGLRLLEHFADLGLLPDRGGALSLLDVGPAQDDLALGAAELVSLSEDYEVRYWCEKFRGQRAS
jgi:hypothetical protein